MHDPNFDVAVDWRSGEPLFHGPLPDGMTLAEVDLPEKKHKCGLCNNGTGIFNPDCPGRKAGS